MKNIFKFMCILGVSALTLAGCNKNEAPVEEPSEPQMISMLIGGNFRFELTKATEISNMSQLGSLYWAATTGSSGSETAKWTDFALSPASCTQDPSTGDYKIATGKTQESTPVYYNYYVSNVPFRTSGGALNIGTSVALNATNDTDVVVGSNSSNNSTVSVELQHIFARTGSLTVNAPDGYSFVGTPTWTIVGNGDIQGMRGTFNVSSGAWTEASSRLNSKVDINSSSDFYLIPGTYTLEVTYTLTDGVNWTKENIKNTADVTLAMGYINNISGTVTDGGGASNINLVVTLADWGTNNIEATFNQVTE